MSFLRGLWHFCTFSLEQRDASPRGKLASWLSNVFLGLKCLCRSHRQTDNMVWLITHTGTFSSVDANNLVYFEFRTSVVCLFFYSGSVAACKMTEWKPYYQNKWRKYFTGNAWYKYHQVPSLWQLAMFKVGSDTVQLCYSGSGFSRNSYTLRSRRWKRSQKSRVLWGYRGGGREGL